MADRGLVPEPRLACQSQGLQLPKHLFSVDETASLEIFLRNCQGPMQSSAVNRVEPVALIKGNRIHVLEIHSATLLQSPVRRYYPGRARRLLGSPQCLWKLPQPPAILRSIRQSCRDLPGNRDLLNSSGESFSRGCCCVAFSAGTSGEGTPASREVATP